MTTLLAPEIARSARHRSPKGSWSDRKIIEAWHGPLKLAQIASRSRRGAPSTISRIWKEAKDNGALPMGDRPHFPQVRRTVTPPSAATRDVLNLASIKPVTGYPTIVTEVLTHLAGYSLDDQFEAIHVLIAAVIKSQYPQHQHIFMVDLMRLHVRTMLRRHYSGEKPLPAIAYHSDRTDDPAATSLDEAAVVHLSI